MAQKVIFGKKIQIPDKKKAAPKKVPGKSIVKVERETPEQSAQIESGIRPPSGPASNIQEIAPLRSATSAPPSIVAAPPPTEGAAPAPGGFVVQRAEPGAAPKKRPMLGLMAMPSARKRK